MTTDDRRAPRWPAIVAACVGLWSAAAPADAHSGPPFPILSNHHAGAYVVSIWTDPDATDDGQAGGQFWVVLQAADGRTPIPAGTRASVAIRPLDRRGPRTIAAAAPVDGLVTRQFAALVMNHEGRFAVSVAVDGPLGRADVASAVDATYDLRPAPILLVVYLLPFLALGALWVARLRRRPHPTPGSSTSRDRDRR